jgi:small subunit ribosomal protein S16
VSVKVYIWKVKEYMLKIRLRRMGARGKPSYRVIVVDSQKPRDGASVEIIGHFDPRTEPETISIKEDRALYWLKLGAQPTDTTARLLGKAGIMEKFKPVKEKA